MLTLIESQYQVLLYFIIIKKVDLKYFFQTKDPVF